MKISLFLIVVSCFSRIFGEQYPEKFEGKFEDWKAHRIDLVSLFVPKNPVVLQAGGYYGDEAMELAKKWPEGKIISFEPNPHAFEILSSKVATQENVYPYNLALNSYTGNALFYVCYGSFGNDDTFEHVSSLLPPSSSMQIHFQGPVINVDCVTIDDWCKENSLTHVDLLCLDVRGSELHVLANSPHILRTVKCLYVHTNFYPFRMGITLFPDLRKFLEKSGFVLLSHWYREGFEGDAIFIKDPAK